MPSAFAKTMSERSAARAERLAATQADRLAGCIVTTHTHRPERGKPFEVTTWFDKRSARRVAMQRGGGPIEMIDVTGDPSVRYGEPVEFIGVKVGYGVRVPHKPVGDPKPNTTIVDTWTERGRKKHGVPQVDPNEVAPEVQDLEAQVRWLGAQLAKIAAAATPAPTAPTPPLEPVLETPRRRRRRGGRG